MYTIRIEPENETIEFERLNTVLQLLNRLGLRRTDALIIRGDELLTPDRRLSNGDRIIVRKVRSTG